MMTIKKLVPTILCVIGLVVAYQLWFSSSDQKVTNNQVTSELVPEASIQASNGWIRMAPATAGASAAYLTLTNATPNDDRLIAITGDVAHMIQLHETKMHDGVMSMQEVEGGIDLPADSQVDLKPGGQHIMLMRLAAPLVQGKQMELTLTFEEASPMTVSFTVQPITYSGN